MNLNICMGSLLGFLLCAALGGMASGVEVGISVNSRQDYGDLIFPPGEHVIDFLISGQGQETPSSILEVSLTRLHHAPEHRFQHPLPELDPGRSFHVSIPLRLLDPGLYSVEWKMTGSNLAVGGRGPDLRVSPTTNAWQKWRLGEWPGNRSRLLLAFYYPWYGTPSGPSGGWVHWNPASGYDSTHVPIIGFYDSRSDDVIRYHVRVAKSVGLTGFISSWWGPGNYIDDGFSKLLEIGSHAGFNCTVYLENANTADDLYHQLRYILTRYGAQPGFLRWNGKPVVFIYSRVINSLDLQIFAEVFSRLEAEGLPAFYLADRLDESYLTVFDGIHSYSPLSVLGKYPYLARRCRELGKVFAGTIAPGYDDTIIRHPGLVIDRGNGSYYQDGWEMLMVSQPDWVLITSWNEWHEGSEIEPSLELGDFYLNLTSTYYRLFEAGQLTDRLAGRIDEVSTLFQTSRDLIHAAESKGMDVRLMRRDYSIAENAWERYDYDLAKMYLQRIVNRGEEIGEVAEHFLLILCPSALCLWRLRSDHADPA